MDDRTLLPGLIPISAEQIALDDISARYEAANAYGGDRNQDIPRAVAALEAILEMHVPAHGPDRGLCGNCGFSYPCSTVKAISSALLGTNEPEGAAK